MNFEKIMELNRDIKRMTNSIDNLCENVSDLTSEEREAIYNNVIGNGLIDYHVNKLKKALEK